MESQMFQGRLGQQEQPLDDSLLRIVAAGPCSGHGVAKRLGAGPRPIYLSLHRLERQRLLTSEWRTVPGRRLTAKYYRVTAAGLGRLGQSTVAGVSGPAIHPLSVLLAMAVIGQSVGAAALGPSRQHRLTILLDQQVPVSADEWRHAAIEVTRILGAIGVDVDFPERPPAAGFVIHAVIVGGGSQPSPPDEVPLGMTPPGRQDHGADLVLFYDHIQEFANVHRKPIWHVLALVLAHEIGHVLLPSPAHSRAGIMQTPWDRHAMDQADDPGLRFTPQQGELMRQRLDPCCVPAAAR
jgi:Transcriptional regulator PadR-like family